MKKTKTPAPRKQKPTRYPTAKSGELSRKNSHIVSLRMSQKDVNLINHAVGKQQHSGLFLGVSFNSFVRNAAVLEATSVVYDKTLGRKEKKK